VPVLQAETGPELNVEKRGSVPGSADVSSAPWSWHHFLAALSASALPGFRVAHRVTGLIAAPGVEEAVNRLIPGRPYRQGCTDMA